MTSAHNSGRHRFRRVSPGIRGAGTDLRRKIRRSRPRKRGHSSGKYNHVDLAGYSGENGQAHEGRGPRPPNSIHGRIWRTGNSWQCPLKSTACVSARGGSPPPTPRMGRACDTIGRRPLRTRPDGGSPGLAPHAPRPSGDPKATSSTVSRMPAPPGATARRGGRGRTPIHRSRADHPAPPQSTPEAMGRATPALGVHP